MNIRFIKMFVLSLALFLLLTPMANAEQTNPTTVPGMEGFLPPTGTVATANSTYSSYKASNAMDGRLDTYWNANGYSGTVQFDFPSPVNLDFVQTAAYSSPASKNYYTIYGLQNGTWTAISTRTEREVKSTTTINAAIPVTSGSYNGIKVVVEGGSSWAHLNELTLGIQDTPDYTIKNLTATAGDTQVILSWEPIEKAESYTIKYGTQSGKYDQEINVSKDSYDKLPVLNLTNGVTYYFAIGAHVTGTTIQYSSEASATPISAKIPLPEPVSDNRALLVITMTTGLEKEYDLSMKEVGLFISWFEARQSGSGAATYAIDRGINNKSAFVKRKDYILYDRVLTFEVNEYEDQISSTTDHR